MAKAVAKKVKPRPPPAAVEPSLDDAEGVVWVPREAFADVERVGPLPPFVQMPAYEVGAYEVVDERTGRLDPRQIRAWNGKAVRMTLSGKSYVGALGLVKGARVQPMLVTLHGWNTSTVQAVGRLRLKPGRRGAKLSYAEVFERVPTRVSHVVKRGATLALTCRMPPDGRKPPFASESDVLALLARPLGFEFFAQRFKKKAPLGAALARDLRALELGEDEALYPAVARSYIAAYRIEGATRPRKQLTPAALDAMAPSAALAALSADWPTFTLHVEVTDPAHIAHVDEALPMFSDGTLLAKAARARPEPPSRPKPTARRIPPDRVVLWVAKGASDKVWIATRDGARWTAQYGRRTARELEAKTHALASAEAASAALAKAAAAKRKDGYRVAPTYAAAAATLWKRLGLEFDDSSGVLVVTRVGPPAKASKHLGEGFRAGDTVESVRYPGMGAAYRLRTIEELAVVVESRKAGEPVLLDTARRLGNSGMSTVANVKLR